MKTCYLCGEEKPLIEFHKSKRSADGHQAGCKACRCAQQKARYEADKDAHRACIAARQKTISGEVKLFAIAKARNVGYSLEKVQAEIDKCDLVCANCHRERTFQRYAEAKGSV